MTIKKKILKWKYLYFDSNFIEIVPKGPFNPASLVLVKAWCQKSNKLLSEPMIALFTDTYMYMHHSASMS